jgi:hypothetical protein
MQEIQELREAATELSAAAKGLALSVAERGVSSTSGVHIHGSGLLAVLVALVGFVGIVVAVAAVLVVAAWRSADMSALQTVRDDMDMAAARIEQHERRLTKLENPPQ